MDFFKKKYTVITLGIIIITIIIVSFSIISHRKVSILDSKPLTTTGYNGFGEASIKDSVRKNLLKIQLKKAGYSDAQIKYIKTSNASADSLDVSSDKYAKLMNWNRETDIKLSKSSGLKNGDKISVSVITNNDKTNPIKQEKKTYTVSGLKKQERESTKKLFDQIKLTFGGLQNHGYSMLTYQGETLSNYPTTSDLTRQSFGLSKKNNLKNGDKVKITLPLSILNTEYVNYRGKITKTFTVTGLHTENDIENLNDIIKNHLSDPSGRISKHIYLYSTMNPLYDKQPTYRLIGYYSDSSDNTLRYTNADLEPRGKSLVFKEETLFDDTPFGSDSFKQADVQKDGIKIK